MHTLTMAYLAGLILLCAFGALFSPLLRGRA